MTRKQINEFVKATKFLRPRTSTGCVMFPSTDSYFHNVPYL